MLLRKQSGANFSYLLSSFRRVLCPVHWALSLPSTCPLLLPPAWRAERSLSLLLLFSLLGPPPIALAISAAPARNRRGPSCEARVGSGSAVSLHSNYVRGSFAFARSREILRVLRPRFYRRGHLVHRYYQKVSCLRYCY